MPLSEFHSVGQREAPHTRYAKSAPHSILKDTTVLDMLSKLKLARDRDTLRTTEGVGVEGVVDEK